MITQHSDAVAPAGPQTDFSPCDEAGYSEHGAGVCAVCLEHTEVIRFVQTGQVLCGRCVVEHKCPGCVGEFTVLFTNADELKRILYRKQRARQAQRAYARAGVSSAFGLMSFGIKRRGGTAQ